MACFSTVGGGISISGGSGNPRNSRTCSAAARCDASNVFVKKNQRLNLIFAKIIFPACFVRRDPVAPLVDYFEVKFGDSSRLQFLFARFEPRHLFGTPWPRRPPARHGSGAASRCILARGKQPREVALHSRFCMQEFLATSGAFVRNNSTLRQCRKLHWLPYFARKMCRT